MGGGGQIYSPDATTTTPGQSTLLTRISPGLASGTSTSLASGPPRPECVPMDGEVFGQVLEMWSFLCTFSTPLKIVAIPSLNHFANALKVGRWFVWVR